MRTKHVNSHEFALSDEGGLFAAVKAMLVNVLVASAWYVAEGNLAIVNFPPSLIHQIDAPLCAVILRGRWPQAGKYWTPGACLVRMTGGHIGWRWYIYSYSGCSERGRRARRAVLHACFDSSLPRPVVNACFA